MTVRQRRMWTWVTAGLTVTVAVVLCVVGWAQPVRVQAHGEDARLNGLRSNHKGSANTEASTQAHASLDTLMQLAALDLRRTLEDPPQPTTTVPDTQPTQVAPDQLGVQLIGTVFEKDHSMAIFQRPDGLVAVCAVGESLELPQGGFTVESIDLERVTVAQSGNRYQLEVPRPQGLEGQP
ncbi:MAG: hypothetical protein GC164_02370 [Phycisphaera sp.]|nr:hypothetical protein [Phycisphaera sp.]